MQILTAEALILDVVDLHDTDRIVTFLTPERGKKRGVARGAKRKHSRYSGQLQPLARVRITWVEKEGRDLVRVSSVEMIRSAQVLQGDLEGILLGCYLADHLGEFAQENESCQRYFRLLDSTVAALTEGADRHLAARFFEVWMLRLAGIFPPPAECPQCGGGLHQGAVLPPSAEALLCGACTPGGGLKIPPRAIELLLRMGQRDIPGLAAEGGADPETLNLIERLCGRVRRAFLQYELKSYRVMRETLGAVS